MTCTDKMNWSYKVNVLNGSAVVEVMTVPGHLAGHCNYVLSVELSDQLHS